MGLLQLYPAGQIVNPDNPQRDLAVGPGFERFDGLEPLDHPAGGVPPYGTSSLPANPRPGQGTTPLSEQVFTPGAISGVVGTIEGQPLPVSDRIFRPAGAYTGVVAPSVQFRLGVGQSTAAGAQQTVALSEITSNPPVPGDLTSIIAGLG